MLFFKQRGAASRLAKIRKDPASEPLRGRGAGPMARWAFAAFSAFGCSGGATLDMNAMNGSDMGADRNRDAGTEIAPDAGRKTDTDAMPDGRMDQPKGSPCQDTGERFVDCFETSGIVSDNRCLHIGAFCLEFDEGCSAGHITSNAWNARPDLVCLNANSGVQIYKNQGQFQFEDVTIETGITKEGRYPIWFGVAIGDINGDACDDIVATPVSFENMGAVFARDENRLPLPLRVAVYQNDCSGHFTDVSEALGFGTVMSNELAFLYGVSLADVNGDGRLDVMLIRATQEFGVSVTWLYVSQADGTWREQSRELLGVLEGSPYTMFGQDVDWDGLDDLIVLSNPNSSPNASSHIFLRSAGKGLEFREADLPIIRPIDAMGGAIAQLTIGKVFAITDIGHHHMLLISRMGEWTDIAADIGAEIETNLDPYPQGKGKLDNAFVGFAPRFLDMDGDGSLDLVVTGARDGWNRGPPRTRVLLWSRGKNRFVEATDEVLGPHSKHAASGLTVADLDGDGRPDLIPSNQGLARVDGQNVDSHGNPIGSYPEGEVKRLQVLWNRIQNAHAFSLRVIGDGIRCNTNGIGAFVTVTTPDGVSQGKAIQPAGSNVGWSEARTFFNFGEYTSAEVTIQLPNGKGTETVQIEIPEGQTAARATFDLRDNQLHYDPL